MIKKATNKIKLFRPRIRSRHPSHSSLRTQLPLLPCKSIVRLGSVAFLPDTVSQGGNRLEINTIDAVETSSDKFCMKTSFRDNDVKTAEWASVFRNINDYNDEDEDEDENEDEDDFNICLLIRSNHDVHSVDAKEISYPLVAKHIYGSRNRGNTLINSYEELETWIVNKDLDKYIIEVYFSGTREYRLHVTKHGCFYTNRKMLKENTPENQRWFRNDSNSVWILEDNPSFDKPVNWLDIEKECVKALIATGLDIGAIDLRVQSAHNRKGELRENPDFIVIEINSAPSLGEITLSKYLEIIPQLLLEKYNELHTNI